jgi:hypothetical protein
VKIATAAAALAGAMRMVIAPETFPSGSLPMAGALRRVPSQSPSGHLPLAGDLHQVTATMSMAGPLVITSTLVTVPVLFRQGVIALAGALVRRFTPATTVGAVPMTGALKRVPVTHQAATLPLSGIMQQLGAQTIAMSGELTPSGALTTVPALLLVGMLELTRTLRQDPSLLLAGFIEATSALGAAVTKLFVRELTPTGQLLSTGDLIVEAEGTVTPIGDLVREPELPLASELPLAGALRREPELPFVSVLPMEGTLQQDVAVLHKSELAMAGVLSWTLSHQLAGHLDPDGRLVRIVRLKPITRVIDLAGTLTTATGIRFVELSGELTLAGSVLSEVALSMAGTLGLSGLLTQTSSLITRIGTIVMARMRLGTHGAAKTTLTDQAKLSDKELH